MNWGDEDQRKMHIKFIMEQYAFFKNIDVVCPYLPDALDIDISNRCNLRCISCFHSIKKFKHFPDMTLELFERILDEAEGLASRITIGNHGEPFLHPDLFKMLEMVKDKGFFLNLITNGTLLNQKKARRLAGIGVDRLVFSVDSVDPDVYPQIRKNANYRQTIGHILYFLKHNYESGLKTYVNISMVNTEPALDNKYDLFEFFDKLPVHGIYVSPLLNFHDMLPIRKSTKFYKHYRNIRDPEQLPVCTNGFDRLLIRPNGNASLCGIDWDSVHILGNVMEKPYTELWNNEKAQQFRKALISRDYTQIEKGGTLCSQCDCKWNCSVENHMETIADKIAGDLMDTKSVISRCLMEGRKYENLIEELCRLGLNGTGKANQYGHILQ